MVEKQKETLIGFVKGTMGIELKGNFYNAEPYPTDETTLEKDVAYILGSCVLPFNGLVEKRKEAGIYLVKNDNGDEIVEIIYPKEDEEEEFSPRKIVSLEIDSILERVNEDNFLSPEEIQRINMSSEVRYFDIHEDDDFLKKMVKTIINEKHIDLKLYTSRLPKRHNLSNMISALMADTKMSVSYFKTWSELLGFEYTVVAVDSNKDGFAPIGEIKYESKTNDIEK